VLPIAEIKDHRNQPGRELNLSHIKITPRDQQVLQLIIRGCRNKQIASQLHIRPRTVKQHLRTLFLRAGIRDGRKRVKLPAALFGKGEDEIMQPRERLTTKELQVAALVWEGLTNREIARALGTTEQVVKNYLRNTFDKLGVWSRLELAIYVAGHGARDGRMNETRIRMPCPRPSPLWPDRQANPRRRAVRLEPRCFSKKLRRPAPPPRL